MVAGKTIAVRRFALRRKLSIKSSTDYNLLLKRKARSSKARAKAAKAKQRK